VLNYVQSHRYQYLRGRNAFGSNAVIRVICKVAIVRSSNHCFIPNLSVVLKLSKIRYCFMKLGISSEDLQDLIFGQRLI
jgi:hypothetical protein